MFKDKYELLSQINKDIDEKFKARKKGSQEYYIVSRLKKHFKYDRALNEVIQISLPLIKVINHPNILQLIDFMEDSDYYYSIYEYCEGGSLENYLEFLKENNKTLNEEEVQHIMKQLVEAVKYLHNKKIVHRDIKPRHLLIKYDSEEDLKKKNILKAKMKLTGFTISDQVKKGESLYLVAGTQAYMAPEIYGYKVYNEKVDIWSLGVIFSELLSCNIKFNPKKPDYYHEGQNFSNLSKEANSFIQCMLRFEPEKRKGADELSKHDFLIKEVKNFSFEK